MSNENQQKESSMSLSKERKLARKKEIAQMKRQAVVNKIVAVCVIAALCIGLVSFVGYKIYRSKTKVVANNNYSMYLNDNGFIKDVNATDSLDLADYSSITVPASDIAYSDEDMEKQITSVLESHQELNKETQIAIADKMKVNIDYVGTIDGSEFEGGNTQGKGTDLTIGSGDYVDGFEEQLIGHKVGDEVTVNVTFPDDYKNNESLAGEDAKFVVKINGIYITPELTDEFVKENLSDYAKTADEYKEYLKTTNEASKLTEWIETYLADHTTVIAYPDAYVKQLKCLQKYTDINMYNYMNQMYQSYYGVDGYKNFESYVDMSEAKYDKSLTEPAKKQAEFDLIYQAILEKAGITLTSDDLKASYEEQGKTTYDTDVKNYGLGYIMQNFVKEKALELVKKNVTVQ